MSCRACARKLVTEAHKRIINMIQNGNFPNEKKMSSVFESCEQQFGQITAEVTSRIGKIPKLSGGGYDLSS